MKLIPDRMNTPRINLIVAGISVVFLLGVYVAMIVFSPLPMEVIDSNKSGIISFGEALDGSDVGVRESKRNSKCTEYYWYKDGLPAYEECPAA